MYVPVVVLLLIWRPVYGVEYIEGTDVHETWNDDTVVFRCQNLLMHDMDVNTAYENRVRPAMPITKIDIIRCPPPRRPYSSILRTIGLNASSITEINIFDTPLKYSFDFSAFVGLTIEKLSITYSLPGRHGIMNLDKNAFISIRDTLLRLKLSTVFLPRFPSFFRVQNLTLERGESQDEIGECGELRILEVSEWHIPDSDKEGWVGDCKMLQHLYLEKLTQKVAGRFLSRLPGLKTLSVRFCRLDSLPETFRRGALLENFDLSNNKLNDVPSTLLQSCTNLKYLNISSNNLKYSWQLKYGLESLSALRVLDLSNNLDLDICGSNMVPHIVRLKLEYLYLQRTGTKYLCFKMWNTLKYLDVSHSQLYLMGFQLLPNPQLHSLYVNLDNNKFISMPMTKEQYNETMSLFTLAKNTTVLLNMTTDCVCSNGILAKALRQLSGHLNVLGLQCKGAENISIYEAAPSNLECDRWTCQSCECTKYWASGRVFIECDNDPIHRIPTVENEYSMRAPNQLVRTIRVEDLRDSLMVLDLRDNRIQRLDSPVVRELFKVKGRRIRLTGNPLVCDCDNWPLIEAIQNHKDQIIEYSNTWCSFSEKIVFIGNVSHAVLCAAQIERVALLSAATGGAFLSVLALAGLFLYRYRNVVKIYLFSRGWCLACLQEDVLDADKIYDAFISYSHHDDAFVAAELIPQLDGRYRLCVHTRDWVPGEMIPMQIVKSVNLSRRTIIVLSNQFLTSIWGMMEFRTAYLSALREGRARVILIVLDDVIEAGELTEELRDYLRTNTYLKWNDPWFWKKLKYALPHMLMLKNDTSYKNLLESDDFGGSASIDSYI